MITNSYEFFMIEDFYKIFCWFSGSKKDDEMSNNLLSLSLKLSSTCTNSLETHCLFILFRGIS